MNNSTSLTTIGSNEYSQFFELAISMANNLNREEELKILILEKSNLVEELVKELKEHEEEFKQIKEHNIKFKEFCQTNKLVPSLKVLLEASKEVEDESK